VDGDKGPTTQRGSYNLIVNCGGIFNAKRIKSNLRSFKMFNTVNSGTDGKII